MSVRLILLMAVCKWSLPTDAVPVLPSKLDQNQTNDLDQLSLLNFSSASSDVDVNQTVNQVEQILKAYPSLPRLTKGDILTLLNNITTEDKITQQKKSNKRITQKSKATNNKSNRASDSKPLMVVLPYKTADSTNGDVTELYTKAPIIRYISPKPVRGNIEGDVVDSESAFTNHKYTDEESTKKTKHTLQDDFWHNEAQRVMNDLKKQSDSITIKKEHKNTDVKEVPFKKMPSLITPQSFNPKLPDIVGVETFSQFDGIPETQSSEQLGESNDPSLPANMNDLLNSMGLYEQDNVAENIPFKYIDNPIADTVKLAEYSSIQTPLKPFQSVLIPETSAYMEFKPMPFTKKPSKEAQNLDDILNSYGIFGAVNEEYLPNLGSNSQINIGQDLNKNTEFIQPDLFPADMTSMLTEMGLTGKRGRNLNYLPSESEDSKPNKNRNSDLDVNETDGYSLGAGPDPMSVEEIYPNQSLGELVKRQETESVTEKLIEIVSESTSENNSGEDDSSSGTSSDNTDSEKSKSSNDSTETNSDVNTSEKLESLDNEAPNLADLENSFGASPADNDPSEAELPPPRKNGFYYMVDWNSFLEVGEGDTKVNIRFNPKLGDPQRFLAVTVP